MTAALHWYVGRDKTDRTYVTAPHYFDQVLRWFEGLSLDNRELVHTVHEVYTRSGWGERIAEKYASDLPAVPRYLFRADK